MDELAALKTESGIRNWHLMVPNWSDGASMSNKGRRRHDRQLEREVRGWKEREEREKRAKEQKRMDEEWAINEYVRRGEVESERIGSADVKEGMLALLRKRKEEKMGSSKQQVKSDDVVKQEDAFTSDKESQNTISSHLMTLSGEVSVYDIPDSKQQAVRLQSQSDFATIVVLLDSNKLASCIEDGKSGIYMEFTIQSAGLAQIGWIRSPDPKCDDSPQFLPNSDTGDGVGDDAASFGYDGSRGMKFHGGKEEPYGQGHQWTTGDILGCWCRLVDNKRMEIGYALNGKDVGVAFSLPADINDLSRYFPAVSLNLGEVVDMKFEPAEVKEGCIDASSLVATEDELSDSNDTGTKADDTNSSSPPKKKAREDADLKQRCTHGAKPDLKNENSEDLTPFDLNSCKSVDELLAMDQTKLKNILLSMGVKCG